MVDEQKRSAIAELDYQLATRYFASAFEHCEKLSTADQRAILNDLAQKIADQLAVLGLDQPSSSA
jgi:hypothetical protein